MRYNLLPHLVPDPAPRRRVVENLRRLREQLDRDVPRKDASDNLLLASWNIRDLAKTNRRGYGKRLPETYFYIAEVLSRFDFVAVQEVNELDEWEEIVSILGYDYGWIATDVTDPGLGGNGERLTYLYDRRKVRFQNIAGELVLPTDLLISSHVGADGGGQAAGDDIADDIADIGGTKVGKQFRRTPFAALFQSAWFKFEICTVHIYYGDDDDLSERIQEIQRIAEYFGRRAERSLRAGRSLILLGDFNVVARDHETMRALLSSGFTVPKALDDLELGTNVKRDKYYDQIVFRTRPGDLAYLETSTETDPRAGAFDIFERVFTAEQFADYRDDAKATGNGARRETEESLRKYYLDWRTYQFSDHLPLWVRLKVNDSASYLERLLG